MSNYLEYVVIMDRVLWIEYFLILRQDCTNPIQIFFYIKTSMEEKYSERKQTHKCSIRIHIK